MSKTKHKITTTRHTHTRALTRNGREKKQKKIQMQKNIKETVSEFFVVLEWHGTKRETEVFSNTVNLGV